LYLERNILTLDVADFSHALPESCPPLEVGNPLVRYPTICVPDCCARAADRKVTAPSTTMTSRRLIGEAPSQHPLRAFFAELYYRPAGWRRRPQAVCRAVQRETAPALGHVRLGSCVTSIAMSTGDAQLYER
jgi:hypothetical protein